MKKLYTKNQSVDGFTLVEIVVALGIFTLGIVGAMTLALANSNNASQNLTRVRAANLAREGLELVRNVRDSNWLRIEANEDSDFNIDGIQLYTWDYGLNNHGNFIAINYNDDWPTALSCSSFANCFPCLDPVCQLAPNMSRAIQLEKICVDEGDTNPQDNEYILKMTDPCSLGDSYIGIRATIRMQWEQAGTKYLELSENFYNWRY